MKKKIALVSALALLFSALSGCGQKSAESADMSALWAQMEEEVPLSPMRPLSEKRMRDRYGIDPAAQPQTVLMVSEDSLRVDEIWLMETADEEAARVLCDTAERYLEQRKAETKNYLPEQYAVLGSARVLRRGTQMALIISPEAEALARLFENAVK